MANVESGSVVGMHPDELVGNKCVDLFPAELAQQLLAADRRAAAEGEPSMTRRPCSGTATRARMSP